MPSLRIRASSDNDVPYIVELCKRLYGQAPDIAALLSGSLICLSSVNNDGKLVGFLALNHAASLRYGSKLDRNSAEAWLKEAPSSKSYGTAFISALAIEPGHETEATKSLLKHSFTTISSLSALLIASEVDIAYAEPSLSPFFSQITAGGSPPHGLHTYMAHRSNIVPPLTVRRAVVEDHDEMLPIMEATLSKYPALASLPESCSPDEPFALTRLVSSQDSSNCMLISKDEDGGIVGFIVLTSEVETAGLLGSFDLHPFDNFLPIETYESQYNQAKKSVHGKKLKEIKRKLAEEAAGAKRHDAGTETDDLVDPEDEEERDEEDEDEENESRDVDDEQGKKKRRQKNTSNDNGALNEEVLRAATEPLDDEVKKEMLEMFGAAVEEEERGGGFLLENDEEEDEDDLLGNIRNSRTAIPSTTPESTVFAITMLCMHEEREHEALDLLRAAFDEFPSKDYCLVTLPHDSSEPPLMSKMTRITPLPGADFPEVLYLFNRHALLDSFEVRLGVAQDAEGVSNLLVDVMPMSPDEIKEAFLSAQERGAAIIACCQGEIVGVLTVNPKEVDPGLRDSFSLSSVLGMVQGPGAGSTREVDVYCMNPIFANRHRELLAGALHLLHLNCLLYALPSSQPAPDMLNVMQQVPPRHLPASKITSASFSLFALTQRAAWGLRRTSVNARIVIVGASECGLSSLEHLLLHPSLSFNCITLLSPGSVASSCRVAAGDEFADLPGGLPSRLGLEAKVSIVHAELVAIEPSTHTALLASEQGSGQIQFDLLLITSGLQDQTRGQVGKDDIEAADAVFSAQDLASALPAIEAAGHVLVYGDSLDSLDVLSLLDANGATSKGSFYAPPSQSHQPPALISNVLMPCTEIISKDIVFQLPRPKIMSLEALKMTDGSSRPRAFLKGPTIDAFGEEKEDPETEECAVDLLVGCCSPDVSRGIFTSLNNAGIVYDGRLVVDSNFKTSEPSIYAAGSVAKLSRQSGGALLEYCSSKECGILLAESISSLFLSNGDLSEKKNKMPVMKMAKSVGCNLPGGLTFLYAGLPMAMAHPSLEAPSGGKVLRTCTRASGMFQITLDAKQKVQSVVFLGPQAKNGTTIAWMSNLIGLPSSYLNGLVAKFEGGQVEDLLVYFNQAWADVFKHDGFNDFRTELIKHQAASGGGRDREMQVKASIATLSFLSMHESELLGYKEGLKEWKKLTTAVK